MIYQKKEISSMKSSLRAVIVLRKSSDTKCYKDELLKKTNN